MRRITGDRIAEIESYFQFAAMVAQEATCRRARCGAVIVQDGEVIGEGYNSPPLNDEGQRMCDSPKDVARKPKYDKTCCLHAEWRAVLDAYKKNAQKVKGATLYFVRLGEAANFDDFGQPFCTTCSRLMMEAELSDYRVWNNSGVDVYPLAEYNQKTYEFYT